MSNINELQMWNDICTDPRIRVRTEFFGIRTIVVYAPPQSVIYAETFEYDSQDGERLLYILTAPRKDLSKAIGNFRPMPISNGDYLLEVARSRDGRFAAFLLKRHQQQEYKAVTTTMIYEDEEAQTICQMF